MNHIQILRRAWNILWGYKAIWIFGILLALTTASAANGGSGVRGGGGGISQPSQAVLPAVLQGWLNTLNHWLNYIFSPQGVGTLIAVIAGLVGFILLLVVVFTIVHNVAQVALIRMVDQYEATGEKASVRQGFHLGWSRAAWKVFLIDLTVTLAAGVVFIVLLGVAAIPVLLSLLFQGRPTVPGIIATVGLVFLVILLAIVVYAFLSLLLQPVRRVCALDGEGVFASLRTGWRLVYRNFWNVFLMWLILIGIQIGYALLLIPIFVLLLLAGGLAGGGVGAGLFFLIRALGSASAAWITGISLGIFLFVLILAVPLLFIGGLKESYISSVWTLLYRQIRPVVFSAPLPSTPEPPQDIPPLPEESTLQ